ncbi:hypothetical protein VUR80DRAFT_6181 [Thermomyces stellatus]
MGGSPLGVSLGRPRTATYPKTVMFAGRAGRCLVYHKRDEAERQVSLLAGCGHARKLSGSGAPKWWSKGMCTYHVMSCTETCGVTASSPLALGEVVHIGACGTTTATLKTRTSPFSYPQPRIQWPTGTRSQGTARCQRASYIQGSSCLVKPVPVSPSQKPCLGETCCHNLTDDMSHLVQVRNTKRLVSRPRKWGHVEKSPFMAIQCGE